LIDRMTDVEARVEETFVITIAIFSETGTEAEARENNRIRQDI